MNNNTNPPMLNAWPQSTENFPERIAKQVEEICAFGGNNKGSAKDFTQSVNDTIQELIRFKCTYEQRDKFPSDARAKIETAYSNMLIQSKAFKELIDKWDTYFAKVIEGRADFNPLGVKFLLEFYMEVKCGDPSNNSAYQKIKQTQLDDIKPIICELMKTWITEVTNPATALQHRTKKEIELGNKYCLELKKEPPDKHKPLVMQYIINDVKMSCFNFGGGNCQLMAELSFLLAIQQSPQTPIRLMQFSGEKYEELNGIVFGEWPKPGCIILAPWYSNKSFEWKGSLKDTPELNHYEKTHTLFTVKNKAEQQEWQGILKTSDFNPDVLSDEKTNKNRHNYLKSIKNVSQNIYNVISSKNQISLSI